MRILEMFERKEFWKRLCNVSAKKLLKYYTDFKHGTITQESQIITSNGKKEFASLDFPFVRMRRCCESKSAK